MKNAGFTNLVVWQRAMDLAEKIYNLSSKFPYNEKFALTNQLRRAVVSVPANIAEGKGRYGDKEFINFLYIARGSLEESKCLVILAQRLSYITAKDFEAFTTQADEVGLLLNALISSMKNK